MAPSVDRFGWAWTAQPSTGLVAARVGAPPVQVGADWLEGRAVRSMRVARDGVRVAVVSAGADGVQVDVAAITRDESGAPQQLGAPVRAGASLVDASAVVWSEESTLAVVGRSVGNAAVHLVPVAGPTRLLPEVADLADLAGSTVLYVTTTDGELRRCRHDVGADPRCHRGVATRRPRLTSRPQPTAVPRLAAGSGNSQACTLAHDRSCVSCSACSVPVECAGLRARRRGVVRGVRRPLAGRPWRCEERAPRLDRLDGAGPLPVWTLADCTGHVRRAVIAWKDRGRLDLTRPFAVALVGAGADARQRRRRRTVAGRPVPVDRRGAPTPGRQPRRRARGGASSTVS